MNRQFQGSKRKGREVARKERHSYGARSVPHERLARSQEEEAMITVGISGGSMVGREAARTVSPSA